MRQIESYEQQALGSTDPPDCGKKGEYKYTVHIRTDSDNLSKSLHKDSGSVKDKRLRIVISMLRETLELEPWVRVEWAPTHEMVADTLTKVDSTLAPLFESFMRSCKFKYTPGSSKQRNSDWSNIRALHDIGKAPSQRGSQASSSAK